MKARPLVKIRPEANQRRRTPRRVNPAYAWRQISETLRRRSARRYPPGARCQPRGAVSPVQLTATRAPRLEDCPAAADPGRERPRHLRRGRRAGLHCRHSHGFIRVDPPHNKEPPAGCFNSGDRRRLHDRHRACIRAGRAWCCWKRLGWQTTSPSDWPGITFH